MVVQGPAAYRCLSGDMVMISFLMMTSRVELVWKRLLRWLWAVLGR